MYTAASGALVAQANVDTIAANLANVNTGGFKRTLLQVQDAGTTDIYHLQTNPGQQAGNVLPGTSTSTPVGKLGLGAVVYDTPTQFEQGPIQQTGNPLDTALSGNAFYTIQTPQGVRYTRDGSFLRSAQGLLVTHDGNLVVGNNGAINLGTGPVAIGADGTIAVNGARIDRLQLTNFTNPIALRPQGANLFNDYGAGPQIDTTGQTTVQQGAIEGSNSNVVRSMVDMISAQRWFEANTKVIQTEDQAASQAIQTIGNSRA